MYFQIVTIATATIAQSVSTTQRGGSAMPMNLRNSLIGPKSGWNSMFHTAPTATVEAM